MTEEEAAAKLRDLLNEIAQYGIHVAVSERSDRGALEVGDNLSVIEPFFEDTSWEVEDDR